MRPWALNARRKFTTNARCGFIRAHRKTLIIGMHCRRVDKHGKVNWQGAEITISGSLRGWSCGTRCSGRWKSGSMVWALEAGMA